MHEISIRMTDGLYDKLNTLLADSDAKDIEEYAGMLFHDTLLARWCEREGKHLHEYIKTDDYWEEEVFAPAEYESDERYAGDTAEIYVHASKPAPSGAETIAGVSDDIEEEIF